MPNWWDFEGEAEFDNEPFKDWHWPVWVGWWLYVACAYP